MQALQQVDDQLVMAFVEFTGLDGVRRVQRDADRHRLAVAQRVIGEHLEFVGGPVPDVQGTHVVLLEGVTAGRYRGLYIQANNMLVFRSPDVAALYGQMFDLALADPRKFRDTDFAKTWHVVTTRNKPTVQVCFSPHRERTCRSTRFAQPWTRPPRRCCIRWRFGGVFEPDDRGADRGGVPPAGQATRLSYGTVDNRAPGASPTSRSSPRTHPSCSRANGPAGGAATSTTNSSSPTSTCRRRKCSPDQSNFSPSGEAGNDDQLIMIDDPRVATAYAIEAVRVFDHLQFRDRMRDAFGPRRQRLAKATAPKRITLQKPTAISGADAAWFDRFYKPDTQAFRDRVVFSM